MLLGAEVVRMVGIHISGSPAPNRRFRADRTACTRNRHPKLDIAIDTVVVEMVAVMVMAKRIARSHPKRITRSPTP